MANDKNKKDHKAKEDPNASVDDFEARTKTLTDEERAALENEPTDELDTSDSKGD